jgi:hypothetical protein
LLTQNPGRNKLIIFSNLFDVGKIEITPVEAEIESTLVYPLLRGRDIN